MASLKSALHDFLEDLAFATRQTKTMCTPTLVHNLLAPEKAYRKTSLHVRLLAYHTSAISMLGLTQAFATLQVLSSIDLRIRQNNEAFKDVGPNHECYVKVTKDQQTLRRQFSVAYRKSVKLLAHMPKMLEPFSVEREAA